MLSVDNLTMEFGGRALLDSISFLINDRDKIALIGRNGAGKTTLLKLLADKIVPTGGNISKPKDLTVGYLPQHLLVNDTKTVFEEALTAFEDVFRIKEKIVSIGDCLSKRSDYQSDEYRRLLEDFDCHNEQLQMFGSNNIEAEAEKTLVGLGFRRSDFDRFTSEFSGGWRMRIELAKILLKKPDLLLLDEPTNHLDIESINWLESFLKNSPSALLLVSHDKTFIDNVTKRTIEISLGKIYDYKVGYSKYLELRTIDRENQLRAYENQQKLIADTKDFINRFRYKPTKSVQVQSRIKMLEKMDLIEVDEIDNSILNLKFPPPPHSGSLHIDIERLTKCYGDNIILQNINLQIHRGEKIAFVGRNGEGKTTLVKCIMGETDYDGLLQLGHKVEIGYFAQNQASLLDPNKSVFQTIDDIAVGDIRTNIRNLLGAFMFGGEEADKLVKVLSGGERSRLAMIKLLLSPVNLLILDEPTNHLDISSKNILKKAIKNFESSAIIVSHDRDFLDGLVDKVYEFTNKGIIEHIGGIEDFLQKKNFNLVRQIESTNSAGDESQSAEKPLSDNKISYLQRKEQSKIIKRQERLVEQIEKEIEKLESDLSVLEQEFEAGISTDEMLAEYQKIKRSLDQKIYEWELLNEELEDIKSDC